MQPDFRKDFQPEGGDPEGSPDCPKDFQSEAGDPAVRRRLKPHARVPEARCRAANALDACLLYFVSPPGGCSCHFSLHLEALCVILAQCLAIM